LHPHVKKLLELQRVDLEVSSLTKDIDQLPAEEAKRKRRLDTLEAAAEEARSKVQRAEMESRSLDNAARSADDEIKRLNERLGVVRNNAEYQATLFQIESVRKERDTTQDKGLELLESLEAMRAERDAAVAAADEERKVFEGFLGEAEHLRSARADDIAAARARRDALTDGIPPDLLRDYDGIYKTREHLAVCAVDDGYCQGCYNKITLNDIAQLMGKSVIVRCGSCQRILHLQQG
jgi:predicted  nucleic acid-binding Zn-ribbon protein